MDNRSRILVVKNEISHHFENEWLPFWEKRGYDQKFGGFLTSYDDEGNEAKDINKYIVTQARMIWAYSFLYGLYPERAVYLESAKQGVEFMLAHFWDNKHEGWAWSTDREGNVLDNGKIIYGEAFMIYALSQYGLSSGDPLGAVYASKTFDLLQKYAADTARGGYYENLEPDWSIAGPGYFAGDRKSLDIHMHLMEAFTTLYQLTKEEIHKRKLNEVIEVITQHMIDHANGCGRNQFDITFNPVPPISINRTWNNDREKASVTEDNIDITSYGHNIELSWLLNRAASIIGDDPKKFYDLTRKLGEHTLKYGIDAQYGGVYRDGHHDGPAIIRDKEWWQQCEALVGLLDAYQVLGNDTYFSAFENCWNFVNRKMINHDVGEWRQLLTVEGASIVSNMGNAWKAMYHTGRSLIECINRLNQLLEA